MPKRLSCSRDCQAPRSAAGEARGPPGLLLLKGNGHARRLIVTMPGKPDAAAIRDGVTAKPPSPAIRAEAWWLMRVLAAAPLSDWTARFGRSPREIVTLRVTGGQQEGVLAGWRLAAASQRNPEWARALLDTGGADNGDGRPAAAWPPDHVLATALPPAEWAAVLRGNMLLPRSAYTYPYRVSEHDQRIDAMLSDLAAFPPPWPSAFSDAVLAAFDPEETTVISQPAWQRPGMRHSAYALLRAAGRCMPVTGDRDYAAELTRLASISPFGSSGFTPAAQAITLRRAFYEEIS